MKKILLVLLPFFIIIISGCSYREIDRGYLATAIGFETKNNKTILYIEAISSSDTMDKSSERVVLVGEGAGVDAAYDNLKISLVKPLYFEQLGTAVFEGNTVDEGIRFLQNIPDVNYGIYTVRTDDIDALFNAETPNGVLGYDIIGLIKTNNKINNQLFRINHNDFDMPVVNFTDEKLSFENSGERK